MGKGGEEERDPSREGRTAGEEKEAECFHSIRPVTREYKPLETADNERRPISER